MQKNHFLLLKNKKNTESAQLWSRTFQETVCPPRRASSGTWRSPHLKNRAARSFPPREKKRSGKSRKVGGLIWIR